MRRFFAFLIPFFLILWGCETAQMDLETSPPKSGSREAYWKTSFRRALVLLREKKLDEASSLVNQSLQDFQNVALLHLLNGRIYEEMSEQGARDRIELADVAYNNTVKLDPSLWQGHYLLGRLKLSQKKYPEAQESFAHAILIEGDHPKLYHELAVSSYYDQDLEGALLAIKKALALEGKAGDKDLHLQRSASMIFAAAGDEEKAQHHLRLFEKLIDKTHPDSAFMRKRLREWSEARKKKSRIKAPESKKKISKSKSPEKKSPEHEVVVLDCYLLRMSEQVTSSRGSNLLSSFSNGISISLNQIQRNVTKTLENGIPDHTHTTTYQNGVTWGNINYNINIMNALSNRIELIGRPTLSTFLNQEAKFNSGKTIYGALSSNAGGSLTAIPSGIILKVTPTKLEGDLVTLNVDIERSFLNYEPRNTLINQMIVGEKTRIQTTVQVRLGETGMVGGLFDRRDESKSDAMPLLGELPLVQYFFSHNVRTSERVSVLFLVTPRRTETVEKLVMEDRGRVRTRKKQPGLKRLLCKEQGIWGVPPPALSTILDLPDPLFYTYRTGDVVPLFWGKGKPLYDEMEQLARIIYF